MEGHLGPSTLQPRPWLLSQGAIITYHKIYYLSRIAGVNILAPYFNVIYYQRVSAYGYSCRFLLCENLCFFLSACVVIILHQTTRIIRKYLLVCKGYLSVYWRDFKNDYCEGRYLFVVEKKKITFSRCRSWGKCSEFHASNFSLILIFKELLVEHH